MPRSQPPNRFTTPLATGDYKALRKLAELQRPALPLQYVVSLNVQHFLDHPKVTLLRPARDESR